MIGKRVKNALSSEREEPKKAYVTWPAAKLMLLVNMALARVRQAVVTQPGRISGLQNSDPRSETRCGVLNGITQESRSGNKYSAFFGIPYGKPPIGKLRFASPVAADNWIGIRDAKSFGNICIQVDEKNKIIGDEDCLFLNVYTPLFQFNSSLINSTLLPVMIWIHGGGFIIRNGNIYGAKYILDEDVILVTINYRLGLFGFMSTGDTVAPGNFGLKDQVLASKWVQENIQRFGGDANQVTIFVEFQFFVSQLQQFESLGPPTDEPDFEDAFLTDSPENLLQCHQMKDFPYMSGVVVDEDLAITSVRISQGMLNGTIRESRSGRRYSAFLGIPYGQPPTGKLRFANPVAADRWEGIRAANTFGRKCIQLDVNNKIRGAEDCLFLNVYTPLIKLYSSSMKNTLLSVMVWIHGGSFTGGSSNKYGAQYLLDKDVILVTINYRLGIFGFLSSGDSVAPGNFGMKDQVLALKWVHTNIEAFGGDKNRVTLFGQSAGGASVSLHAISKASNGITDDKDAII
ncbi:uncharacterized protein LOC117180506 [Belonocnema kinseyi]|uniref:uncharacterized protein LOC117180506 n=1 Tax=Belonocnema kinseyi TaxID=2817044 RepID=UPI00143D734B|nr:uncharacterized protein LOC117180506 [Belonocnema kinseyi]